MTVIKAEHKILASGKKLYRYYSDKSMRIIQQPSGLIFDDAIDPEDSTNTYIESGEPISHGVEE